MMLSWVQDKTLGADVFPNLSAGTNSMRGFRARAVSCADARCQMSASQSSLEVVEAGLRSLSEAVSE